MVNDKFEVLKRISNVIVGHACYNTIFESIKYENTAPAYNPVFAYKWEVNENDNIITLNNTVTIDCADTIDKKSTLTFDIFLYYFIEKNTIEQVQVNITNVKSTYGTKKILLNDFVNGMVQYLFTAIYAIFDGREYIAIEGQEDKTRIELIKRTKVGVGFKKDANVNLSIKSLFINDLVVTYTVTEAKDLLDQVKKHSSQLGDDLKYLLDNQNKEVADLFQKGTNSEAIDVDELRKDFKDVEITSGKTYLFNMTLHKILRSNRSSLSDLLVLYDDNDIKLDAVNYIINF